MPDKPSIFDDLEPIRARLQRVSEKTCQHCGFTGNSVIRRAQRTLYLYPKKPEQTIGDENDPNFVTLCLLCHEENDAYWNGRWEEYYSGLL